MSKSESAHEDSSVKTYRQLSDARQYVLSDERREALLKTQYECTFIWTNKDGHGIGVTQAYTYDSGALWMASEESRARVKAIRRDPRTSVVVSGTGTDIGRSKSLSYKGHSEILEDRDTVVRVLRAIMAKYDPDDPEAQESHFRAADHPGRIIIKFTPEVCTNAWDGDQVRRRD